MSTDKDFQEWLMDVKTRPQRDMDALIAVTGDVRKGKSTLTFKLGKLIDAGFTEERMIFDVSDYIDMATEVPKGSVVVLDEAVEGAMSREAMSRKNRDMQKFLVTCGERNLIGFLLAPHIDIIDSYVTGMRATDWILVEERGNAKLHTRSKGGDYPGRRKGWVDVTRVEFTKATGKEWNQYLRRKSELVREFKSVPASRAKAGGEAAQLSDEVLTRLAAAFREV